LPLNGSVYNTADNIKISYKTMSDTISIDSVVLSINNKRKFAFNTSEYNLSLSESIMGMHRALLTAYSSGKQVGSLSFNYIIKPKNKAKIYSYKIVKEYPHDVDAYTQGLCYNNGFFYEGLGEYGKSALRKVDYSTGKVLENINIDSKHFGEGICLFDNRIYQLTWQNRVGFIYNYTTFEKIGEFNYPTEGWGLTTDGRYLIMSDGSENLYFINPSDMSIVKQIEVYSNAGAVSMLNELEYIEGEIWANIYTDDKIACINPENGEVKAFINLKGILKKTYITNKTDVLNGIAYDHENKRIFVTGKRWSKIFEILLVAE
jgi:glutamine cyclotransferase